MVPLWKHVPGTEGCSSSQRTGDCLPTNCADMSSSLPAAAKEPVSTLGTKQVISVNLSIRAPLRSTSHPFNTLSGRYVVTLSVDRVVFREPIHVGELVTFLASVNYTGRTSMEIGIKVMAENIHTRNIRHANSCFFTMVAVDAAGKPAAIAKLEPQSTEERRRYSAALDRRRQRDELQKQQ